MYVAVIKFQTNLTEKEVLTVADERADDFMALPGLIQKYYFKKNETGEYGGVYIWESLDAMKSYRESDLASSIPAAYQVIGQPTIDTLEVLFPLRA
ncbi:MAG: YdhR family protein [Kordiimonadaceae bacterium]|nr:YdhR family protein [Kordiimonadaceae bacterium]